MGWILRHAGAVITVLLLGTVVVLGSGIAIEAAYENGQRAMEVPEVTLLGPVRCRAQEDGPDLCTGVSVDTAFYTSTGRECEIHIFDNYDNGPYQAPYIECEPDYRHKTMGGTYKDDGGPGGLLTLQKWENTNLPENERQLYWAVIQRVRRSGKKWDLLFYGSRFADR